MRFDKACCLVGAAALVLSTALFPAQYAFAAEALDSQELIESVGLSGETSDDVADLEGETDASDDVSEEGQKSDPADAGSEQGSGEAGDMTDESSGAEAGAPSESTDSEEPVAEAPGTDSPETGESDSESLEAEDSESDEPISDEPTTGEGTEIAEPTVTSLQTRATSCSVITLGGSDRYETSAKQALYAFPRTEWAIVASGAGYADAIGAAGLAGALQRPIILTEPQSLSSTTSSVLRQMGVKYVILLGGTTVSSNRVEQQLKDLVGSGGTVERVCGADRYATQTAVYQYGRSHGLWTGNTVIVANATGFADALSISPVSYKLKAPVFFVNGTNSLPSAQRSALQSNGMRNFLITGDGKVMSSSVESFLSTLGSVRRLSGSDRYATSLAIARYAVSSLGMSWNGTAFTSGKAPYDALGGGPVQGSENSVLVLKDEDSSSASTLPWSSRPSYIKFFGDGVIFSNSFKARIALLAGYGLSSVEGLRYTDNGDGWYRIDGKWYFRSGNDFASGWQTIGGNRYYLDPTTRAMATGWVTIGGVPYEFNSSGHWVTTHYHNIAWAGQPNNYYCGPTSGYMILRNVGATRSASGQALSIRAVASYMQTDYYGSTNFQARSFMNGMNRWLGRNVYTSVHTPSYATVRNAVMNSYRNGYATVVDTVERRGGPHLNGHNNATFYHIMVIDGYNQQTDAVQIVDPGAGTVWPSAAQKFWYPSLSNFVSEYMQHEVSYDREHICVHYAR